MKRKVTYLLKDYNIMLKQILLHTKDIKSQGELMKNKEILLTEVDRMLKKYDKIIDDILNRDKESENEIPV
jgi:hypothetical protein